MVHQGVDKMIVKSDEITKVEAFKMDLKTVMSF